MSDKETAVLLIVHGSVEREEDVPAFVSNIRHGRPAPAEVTGEVLRRWRAIGGSPLTRITEAQARALEARLGLAVAIGARMWHPFVKDVVAAIAKGGVARVLSLPLAPYSVELYNGVAREACAAAGLECVATPSWALEPALIDAFVESIDRALSPIADRSRTHVVLSAHSLPMRVVRAGDRYEHEVRATAAAIAERLGALSARTHVAFQSQGMDGGEWLGPDLPTTLRTLDAAGAREVVVSPIGFLADHTETLYDLDVEAKAQAETLRLTFVRAPALNESKRLVDALERVARAALKLG